MMSIVWISAENDEWTLSNAVRLQEKDACTRMQPNDREKASAGNTSGTLTQKTAGVRIENVVPIGA